MAGSGYLPSRGDLVWIDLNPRTGSEQAGHRPALILSPRTYNRKTGLCVLCPLTRQVKGYAFEVPLPSIRDVEGVVLADQIRTVDWRRRGVRFLRPGPQELVDEVVARIHALIIDPDL